MVVQVTHTQKPVEKLRQWLAIAQQQSQTSVGIEHKYDYV